MSFCTVDIAVRSPRQAGQILLRLTFPDPDARSRVWDLFFVHGTIFLFRVAIAILKLHEADLLECDSGAGLYAMLGSLPAGLWNADRLLKVRNRIRDLGISPCAG